MNRRSFLGSSGALAAVTASGGLIFTNPSRAQTSAPPQYGASLSAHAMAAANAAVGAESPNDWISMGNTLNACLAEWQSSGRDAAVSSVCSRFSGGSVTSGSVNQAQILSYLQMYQPGVTAASVQQMLAYVDAQTTAYKQGILNTIQSQGMSYYINAAVGQSPKIASTMSGSTSGNATSQINSTFGSISPMVSRIAQPPPTDPGGYNCATDGAVLLAAGIAFLTLSVMTAGAFDVLAGAAWGIIGEWGGYGVTVWGAGHALAGCRF